MRVFVVVLVLCGALLAAASSPADQDSIAEQVSAIIDWDVDPCVDFWNFACGTWIKETTLPADKSAITRGFYEIGNENEHTLRAILEDATLNEKLATFYNSCMNVTNLDQQGSGPIQPLLKLISSIKDVSVLWVVVGKLHAQGISAFFEMGPQVNPGLPKQTIATFDQGGLNLPYPSLYTSNDAQSIRKAYLASLTKLFTLLKDPNAADSANATLIAETAIAQFTASPDELVDPFATYNPMSLATFQNLSPALPWTKYLNVINVNITTNISLTVPAYYGNLSVVVPTLKAYWKPYLISRVLKARGSLLSQAFRDEIFSFYGKLINGQQEQSARWKTCIANTDSALGELLGEYYVKAAFPGSSQQDAVTLLNGILGAMKDDLNSLQWMDATTRTRALKKLSMISHLIGSPSNPDNYTEVQIGWDFYSNIVNAQSYAMAEAFAQIGKPTDVNEWQMTAQTVNAYYDPTHNQMVFPAGILQQPYFNHSFPPEMNAGGIGMIMGHELTHGFDNQGSMYDGSGKLVNWWEPATAQKFKTKVQCVIDQYSKFEPIPGVHVNGKLTQGENIADMGGIKNSYHAISEVLGDKMNDISIVPELTRAQLFFVAYGQGWCTKATDAYYRLHTATDPHSPPMFRVMGPLINLPAFAETFECPVGTPMNPKSRCEVW